MQKPWKKNWKKLFLTPLLKKRMCSRSPRVTRAVVVGPMNSASVVSFVRQLDDELKAYQECIIVYSNDAGKRALTNPIFL